ncbi:MAG TPA: exodeoxyribonuclease VII small subunit [Actinobacteria bacterium]|jgi:exodeoxyribonuclease VII small subunit|nr:exodeoxyribonuclease VII small subunit [Actinomycetota bacterium]
MENKNLSFEEAMQRLEDIVNELEKEGITLENAMEKFEEGVKLSEFCVNRLNEAEKKIEELTRTENGELKVNDIKIDE